ncbi:unnamed protein product [Schistocephalus solidus]|uniref:DNA topoisomerase (ATP-hydrolyzing) n=1 Tax=Schistocephalus solidus TaxID=70667 RepID=A0A183SH99_SCHSO|nr:unnamed protein product [Schistocephalus solidus]
MAYRNGGKKDVAAYSSEVQQRLQEFRRLSDQLTEVTLAAMHRAEVQQPNKPLIEVPVMPCIKCGLDNPLNTAGLFDAGIEPEHNDLQRLGRSRSLAVASLGSSATCRYCSTYNPFAGGDIWAKPSKTILNKRGTSQAKNSNTGHWPSTLTASDGVEKKDLYLNDFMYPLDSGPRKLILRNYKPTLSNFSRRSSSFGSLPKMTSQHTQTIFSSVARHESSVIKPRLAGTYGSLYSNRSGIKWQLSSMSKAKPFKKPCLDYGLRKTLSVTNAIVRMPIESSALPSKPDSPTHIDKFGITIRSSSTLLDGKTQPTPHQALTGVICNEAANASEVSSLLSWNMDASTSRKQLLNATRSLQSSPDAFSSKLDNQTACEPTSKGVIKEKVQHRLENEGDIDRPAFDSLAQPSSHLDVNDDSPEVAPPAGKKNALLQTTEDFGDEFKANFSFPRILCEEDQTKEPGDNIEAQGGDENGNKRSTDYWKDQFMTFFQPSDNKLAKKLFGTKMALNKERSRQRSQGKWIIHPCSNFRFYWDLMMLLLLIANLIILPVFISFFMEDIGLETICFNCISDTIFLLDILVNFRTGNFLEKMDKQCHKLKHVKLKDITKLHDANDAGTKTSVAYTLILMEGDSAKTLAVVGLCVVDRDRYGIFPLRGKLLNVREASSKKIMHNAEINNLINYSWPAVQKQVFKGKQELAFYSILEFEEWQKTTSNWHTWRVKYKKCLGTSTSKEAKDYLSDMTHHCIRFRYSGPKDDASIKLAFNKNN